MSAPSDRHRRSFVAGVAIVGVIAALLAGQPLSAAAAAKPTPANVKPVPGSGAAGLPAAPAPASSTSAPAPAATSWKTGAFSGALPPANSPEAVGSWAKVGESGLDVASVAPSTTKTPRKAPAVASSLEASVLSASEAKKHGLSGLVVQLQRSDGGSGAAPVAVRVPNKLLGDHFGGDYASRLRWTQVTPAGEPVPPSKATPEVQGGTLKHADVSDVQSTQDTTTDSTVLTPQVTSSKIFLAASGTPTASDGTGTFAATPLTPASTWDVSAQTGDFSWSYDMRTPPAAAGPAPDLALQYDSQSIDGESGSTNNQPSAVGDGWSLGGGGYIERTYVSCSQDDGSSGPVTTSGDLCWKTDNATISFAGHSGQLIKDASSGAWRLQSDDDSRIEHLTGTSAGCAANGTYDTDCWRVTTTDGTQYYFGLNKLPGWSTGNPTTNSTWTVPVYGNDSGEPCHASSFASSSCTQAWRWNLDYVVDTHGNAEALYYDAETNSYAQDGGAAASYTRGGQLDHIDYGFTAGNAYANNAASDRVTFTYAADGRCSDAALANCTAEPIGAATTPAQPSYYPDVPFDQLCSSSCPTSVSPTFWTDAMLQSVTTYALKSGSYSKVDGWALGHSFPAPGDGTNAALWLTQVTHTGYSGSASIAEPPTVFTGVPMQNRVYVLDGLAPLDKYRISSIQDSLGAVTSVKYSPQECTPAMAPSIEANPQSNTYRCFPEEWSPQVTPPQPARMDLFHKYVVTSTVSNPETGGGMDDPTETDYVYGTPAWRYDNSPLTPDANRTWNQFAGYNTVEVRVGDHATPSAQNVTDYTFFQGMDGDRAAASGGTKSVYVTGSSTIKDSRWFAGQVREQRSVLGVGGATVTDTVSDLWASSVTADDGTNTARYSGVSTSTITAPISSGGSRTTSTTTTYDSATGLPTTVENDSSDAPAKCTTTSYAPTNTSAWIVGLPSRVNVVSATCSTLGNATYPQDAISDTKNSYDGLAWNTAPTKGDVTQTQVVDKYTGTSASTAHWLTQSSSQYDSLGRITQTTDVLGHTSTTTYTPSAGAAAGGGALTSEVATSTAPFSWTTTTNYDPAWGVETSYTDENGSATTATYDALGRRIAVWDPDNPQAGTPNQPSVAYAYTLSQTGANAIQTKTLKGTGVVTSFVLYDGLGRQVQTQNPAEGSGADITDNWYDGQGRVWTTNGDYWAASANPSATLFIPTDENNVAQENVTTFDAVGRATKQTLISYGAERHETNTAYLGADRVDVTPPAGGTPTSTFTNSLGQKTKLVQYLAATPTGSGETTSYSYDPSGHMTKMVDPAGNQWTWSFDVLGRQVSANDPDTGTTTQTFDTAGNVLTTTDARGTTLAYSYDNLNRKTAEYQDAVGSSGTELASWSYDTATLGKNQLASSTRYVGSTAGNSGAAYTNAVNSYDAAGNPTKTTVTIPASAPAFAGSYVTTSTYATSGDLTSTTYPAEGGLSSERVRTLYDFTGRPANLTGASNYDVITYNAIGQLTQHERLGTNSLYSDYSYDNGTGQLVQLQHFVDDGTNVHYPSTSNYTNDPAGNVTEIQTTSDTAATDTQCFGYDHLQELTRAWTPSSGDCGTVPTAASLGGPAPYWTDYAVDPATGNRTGTTSTTATTVTTASYSYPTATSLHPHAVSSVTTTVGTGSPTAKSYGYNAEGDTMTRPGETLTYDPERHLATVTDGSNTQSNIYDAGGTLLLQKDGSNYTLYVGGTELHKDGTGSVYAIRTYSLSGTAVAERTTGPAGGNTLRWLGDDNHNTATLEVATSSGATTVRYEDPYGNPRGTSPGWSSGHTFLNGDQATTSATVAIGARTYDPAIGKFLTVDAVLAPLNPLQNNGYAYGSNSPIDNSDPTGNCYQAAGVGCVGYAYVGKEAIPAIPVISMGGSGKASVSPHVSVNSNGSTAAKMSKAYGSELKQWGFKPSDKLTEQQEMGIWYSVCVANGGNAACPDAFKLQLMSANGFMPTDGGAMIQGMIIGGGVFFSITAPGSDGSGGSSKAIDLEVPQTLVGATEDDVRAAIPASWNESAMKKGVGVRWNAPGGKAFAEYSYGNPDSRDPMHQGTYTRASLGGLQYRSAGPGNPTLGTPDEVDVIRGGSIGSLDLTPRGFGARGASGGE